MKPGPPFGIFGTRKDALKEYSKQLDVIASFIDGQGPYLCGEEVSLADATLFPSIVFAAHMFPKFDHSLDKPIPDKIENWLSTNGFLKDSVGMEDSDSLLIITPVLDCCR